MPWMASWKTINEWLRWDRRKILHRCVWCLILGWLVVWGGYGVQAAKPRSFGFKHKPPEFTPPDRPLSLWAQAINNDDLENVYLYYRVVGEGNYRFLLMKLFSGDQYRVILPATAVRKPALEYYMLGVDVSQRRHYLFGHPTKPHRVSVRRPVRNPSGQDPESDPALSSGGRPSSSSTVTEDEELVYSASRREQQVQKAPAVVTVITASDIEAAGWRSVLEILRYVVGMSINDNGHWADIGMRGLNPRVSYGDKLLILLDGHSMSWRQFNRNYLNPSWVTVDNIKRIEIIRGPGSTLWGANALSGVINIITKTAQSLQGVEAIGGLAALSQSYFFTVQGGQELPHGIRFRASFSLHRDNRSPILAPIAEFLRLTDGDYQLLNQKNPTRAYDRTRYIPQGDETFSQNFYAWLSWRGLSISFHQSRFDPQAPLSTFSELGGDDSRFVTDRYFTKISWATTLGSWGTLLLWTSFDHYAFAQGTVYEDKPLDPNKRSLVKMAARDARFEMGAQLSAQILPYLSLATGVDFEYLDLIRWHFPEVWAQNQLPIPQFSNIHFSAFLQVQANIKKYVEFTLGGRFDYDQRYGAVFTPRAAATFLPGLGFFLKTLYGNAFQAPSFHDLYYYRANAFYGNPSLKPESVHTMELQIGWSKKKLITVSLNGYLSLFQNVIAYAPKKAGEPLTIPTAFPQTQQPAANVTYQQKANTTEWWLYGGELEIRITPIRGLQIYGGFGVFFGHYIDPETQKPVDLQYTARWSGNLLASYRFKTGPLSWLVSMGAVVTGPKPVPPTALAQSDGLLPFSTPQGRPIYVPYWTNNPKNASQDGIPFDPTLEAPTYVRAYLTVQLLRILRHFDLILRLDNLFNLDLYDASNLFLYPQKKIDLMVFLRVKY